MLSEAFRSKSLRQVRVVDIDPGPVMERLDALIPAGVEVVSAGAGVSVPDYVEHLLGEAALELRSRLQAADVDDSALLTVTWGDLNSSPAQGRTAPVVRVERSPDGAELRVMTTGLTTFEGAIRADLGAPPVISLGQLREQMGNTNRIVAYVHGAPAGSVIIDFTTRQASWGQGNGAWLQLVPAGAPPAFTR